MGSLYLWIKAFHIVFIASWFAGLFYLPRLFVNLAAVSPDSHAERERLLLMARRLYRFASLLMVPALALGFVLWLGYGVGLGAGQGWMHAKLALVVALFVYHVHMGRRVKRIAAGGALPSPGAMRVVNELPLLALVAILWLVLLKPF